jgi:hypothetical protein
MSEICFASNEDLGTKIKSNWKPCYGSGFGSHRIRNILGFQIRKVIICTDPDSDPDPTIKMQKNKEKPWFLQFNNFLITTVP